MMSLNRIHLQSHYGLNFLLLLMSFNMIPVALSVFKRKRATRVAHRDLKCREPYTWRKFKMFSKISTFWNLMSIIIWNHCEKCIQISTNLPRIGLVICEIMKNWQFGKNMAKYQHFGSFLCLYFESS